MKIQKILLLYKKSAYKIHFLENEVIKIRKIDIIQNQIKQFKEAHSLHYQTLKVVTRILSDSGVELTKCCRGHEINYNKYDLIVTVGGDGTFLEAARNCYKHQIILGVNSAPTYSIGRFCICDMTNFGSLIQSVLGGHFFINYLQRIRLKFNHIHKTFDALNDALICHTNPAMLCRYYMALRDQLEEHRSSGMWVATASGSSGAIKSAGGKKLDRDSKKFQYLPRELYTLNNIRYRLKGGILKAEEQIKITSLMNKGMVYIDGAHWYIPFYYGTSLKISLSPNPIKTVKF